jgi:hypothetical protein
VTKPTQYIDNLAAGTVVVDSPPATVAAAGTAIANAAAVGTGYTRVTGANNANAVILPASNPGSVVTLKNPASASILIVFPPVLSQINANGVNNAYNMAAGTVRTFRCFNTVLWESDLETIG